MLTERLTLTANALASAVAGISAYRIQEARLQRRFHQAGLRAYRATLDHGQIKYWAGGRDTGRPLLLIHGFGGDALFGWGEQYKLAQKRFLVAPDLLWFGESHSHKQDFSPAYQAETVLELIDHLALEQPDVVGISYGGFVAGELARMAPERVHRLVMVDSPGHVFTLDDYHHMLDRYGVDSVAEIVVPDDPSGIQRLMDLAYERPPYVPAFAARDVYAQAFTRWQREKVRLLDHLLIMAREVDPADYQLPHRTLVLWGEHDDLFPLSAARKLAAALPDGRLEILPATKHAPNMERPRLFDRLLMDFLDAP